ncbi:MAG: D-aminoacyl-tRNA deacylase [Fimbriimonadaceae bacterium]
MKGIVQRVSRAHVTVEGERVGEIGSGLVVLVAAHRDDTPKEAARLADRVVGCRIFNDRQGRMNLSLRDLWAAGDEANGARRPGVLAVSNFTVYGDTTQRRPSFVLSAPYERGKELFERFVAELASMGCPVQTGIFGAHMDVEMVNDGPVTVIVES